MPARTDAAASRGGILEDIGIANPVVFTTQRAPLDSTGAGQALRLLPRYAHFPEVIMENRVFQELLLCARLLDRKQRATCSGGVCPHCGQALAGEALERERLNFERQKEREIAYLQARIQFLKEEL